MNKFLPPKPELQIPREVFWGTDEKQREAVQLAVTGLAGYWSCRIDEWWDKEIVPLFENAEEVFGAPGRWYSLPDIYKDTHKALVVKITPIKEPTAEDLLRQIVNWVSGGIGCKITADSDVITKAKALLEKK